MSEIIRRTATIANSGTVSTAVNIKDGWLSGIITDSGLEAGTLTFSGSPEEDGTFIDIYDASNTAVEVTTATASRYYTLANAGISGFQYIKVTSATSQTGETTLTFVIRQE